MRDNHLHTHFSYDSDARFEDYLDHYTGDIVTTEHYDLSNPYTKQDDVPDYEAYSREIAMLNQEYGNRIKKALKLVIISHVKRIFLLIWRIRTMI